MIKITGRNTGEIPKFTQIDERVLVAGPDEEFNQRVYDQLDATKKYVVETSTLDLFGNKFFQGGWDLVLYDPFRQTQTNPNIPLSVLEMIVANRGKSNTQMMGFFAPRPIDGDLLVRAKRAGIRDYIYSPDTSVEVFLDSINGRFELLSAAKEDGLTGLSNRKAFESSLREKISEVHRYLMNNPKSKRSLTLAFIDFDNFKDVNTKYGHPGGDNALKYVANGIRSRLKRAGDDLCGRIGGDELAVFLAADLTPEEAMAVIYKKLSPVVAQPIVNMDASIFEVGLSVGAYTYNDHAKSITADEMMVAANRPLHHIKKNIKLPGRVAVCGYDSNGAFLEYVPK